MVGTGSAVSPVTLCLSSQGLGRPIRRSCHPRRSTAFPSLVRLSLPTVPALVVHFQDRIRLGGPDAPTGVSVHRDFHTYSPVGRMWGADADAPILRCRSIQGLRRPRSAEPSNSSDRSTNYIVARGPMILKDSPWRPVGSARPRPFCSAGICLCFASIRYF